MMIKSLVWKEDAWTVDLAGTIPFLKNFSLSLPSHDIDSIELYYKHHFPKILAGECYRHCQQWPEDYLISRWPNSKDQEGRGDYGATPWSSFPVCWFDNLDLKVKTKTRPNKVQVTLTRGGEPILDPSKRQASLLAGTPWLLLYDPLMAKSRQSQPFFLYHTRRMKTVCLKEE